LWECIELAEDYSFVIHLMAPSVSQHV